MEKINIADLLRDCPSGMELDCSVFEDVTLYRIDTDTENEYPIRIKTKNDYFLDLTKYGTYSNVEEAKCVIYPKGKTTWEGFVPPCKFKDGDVLYVDCTDEYDDKQYDYIFIFDKIYNGQVYSYCHYYIPDDEFQITDSVALCLTDDKYPIRFVTEEEKLKLFKAIKDNGYKWNSEAKTLEKLPEFKDGDIVTTKSGLQVFILQKAKSNTSGYCYIGYDFDFDEFFDAGEWNFDRLANKKEKQKLFQAFKDDGYYWNNETKTLEKLIEPIFKINDNIQSKDIKSPVRIVNIKDGEYIFENGDKLDINLQNRWEFVSNKFDINRLIPFESKVLVRDYPNEKWKPAIWGFYDNDDKDYSQYIIESGIEYNYCIPYKGNEHLIGTINECEKYYKTWEDEN